MEKTRYPEQSLGSPRFRSLQSVSGFLDIPCGLEGSGQIPISSSSGGVRDGAGRRGQGESAIRGTGELQNCFQAFGQEIPKFEVGGRCGGGADQVIDQVGLHPAIIWAGCEVVIGGFD